MNCQIASLALWLRRPLRERKIRSANPAWAGIFFPGIIIPVTSKLTLQWLPCQAACRYRLSAGDWSAWCQYTVTGWGRKFDLQLLSQCGSTSNYLSRSLRYTSTLLGREGSKQQTNVIMKCQELKENGNLSVCVGRLELRGRNLCQTECRIMCKRPV